MRRLTERLRASRAAGWRRDSLASDEDGMPWTIALAREPDDPGDELVDAGVDAGVVPALNRLAAAFERIAESLEVDRRERGARLDAVEVLVRDLVTGLTRPTAEPPVVVGGSIDLSALAAIADLPDGALELDR